MNLKKTIYHITHWETWHYLAKYIPIAPVWCWYCIRARSLWFFMPSNPTLTFSGFEGETKREMYEQLPLHTFPKTIYLSHHADIESIRKQVNASGLQYPFAVKPDVGMMGFMFRKIRTDEELANYHKVMPANYIAQELIHYPLEVSVFYYRFPGAEKGTITGFIKKEFLQVMGDGTSTLNQLIEHCPRASFMLEEMKSKHSARLNEILPAGSNYILSHALNLSRGGKLVSLEKEKDEQLLKVFDEISHYTKHFYYGRYDIKCASVEALKKGENFSILEYNGCGAEPHHIYGNDNTLLQAYRIVLEHWKIMNHIASINYQAGYERWSYNKGRRFLRDAKKHFRVLKALDQSTNI